MKTFAQRLKEARETAGYESAQRFAGVLGMEPHAYRMYERAQREPTLETLVRICELLDVDANYLLPAAAKARPRKPSPRDGDGGASRAA
jgi:transcriptional regulator with XRE-family HTH domain